MRTDETKMVSTLVLGLTTICPALAPLHIRHMFLEVRREYVFSEMLHHGESMLGVRADDDMCLINEVRFIVFIEHFPQCFLF